MSKKEWHPDYFLDENKAKNIIEQQFSTLAPVNNIRLIGSGWDNTVFLVNEDTIFRFAHRKVSQDLIHSENKVLPKIHHRFELNIPVPTYFGKPCKEFDSIFHGYKIVKGKPAHEIDRNKVDFIQQAKILAKFLKELHSIREEEALKLGAKHQVFDRAHKRIFTTIDNRISDIKNFINDKQHSKIKEKYSRQLNLIDFNFIQDQINIAKKIDLNKSYKSLVHGDLYFRHLLLDNYSLCGIIDWGDLGINTPVIDLACVFNFLPKSARGTFFEIYGNISDEDYNYAKFIGMYVSLSILSFGLDNDDKLIINEACNILNRLKLES